MVFKQIEHIGKKILVLILGFFLKEEKLTPEDVDLFSIKKILVVRQDDRIGNLILTTPFLSALRRFFPGAHISYLLCKTFHTLFSNSNLVDQIFVAKKRQYIFHPLSLISFIGKIRKQNFDLAFDSSDENIFSFNNSFVAYLSGARYRVGYKKPNSGLFLNLEVPSPLVQRHAAEMHLDLLRFLVGDFEGNDLEVEVNPENRTSVEKYLKKKNIQPDDSLVGINIGARGRKKWDLENFTRLADWIIDNFESKVIFIWGPEEKKMIKGITLKNQNKQILSDLFPLPVLAALIERCNLFISGDTGAMHLSAAVGTPTLALFLDSDPSKFGPRGKAHKIVYSSNGKISMETVKKEIKDMMESMVLVKEKA
ncbi:MAG: glycosyltransferase family 9 protein [Candidatus Zixiibacteriota bacterium]